MRRIFKNLLQIASVLQISFFIQKELLAFINHRQLRFLGPVIRKEGLESVAFQGRVDGKRARGRQRITYLGYRIKKKTNIESTATIFANAHDRLKWKFMTAHACVTCGT